MKRLIALAALLCAAPIAAQNNTPTSTSRPPERFQGDGVAVVFFVSDVSKFCGPVPEGYTVLGCLKRTAAGTPIMILPNPCKFRTEVFAYIACHEKGHSSGWTRMHEE